MREALTGNIFKNIGSVFSDLWDDFSESFEKTAVGEFLLKTKEKVVKLYAEVVDKTKALREKITSAWETVKTKASVLKATMKDKASKTREKLVRAWKTVKTKSSTLKAIIKDTASNVRKNIMKAWTTIKTRSSTLSATIKDKASGARTRLVDAWRTIATKTSTLSAVIKDGYGSARSTIIDAWNRLKSGAATLTVTFVDNFTATMKRIWNSLVSGINSAIDTINKIPGVKLNKLPYLAKGGITTGTTAAVIGEAGREAVLPLENNTGWMDILADKISARSGNNDMPTKIVLKIGEKEFGWASINSINQITKQTGGLQLQL